MCWVFSEYEILRIIFTENQGVIFEHLIFRKNIYEEKIEETVSECVWIVNYYILRFFQTGVLIRLKFLLKNEILNKCGLIFSSLNRIELLEYLDFLISDLGQ